VHQLGRIATKAWPQRDRLWRGLANWRFGLSFSVVIAFTVAFAKLGTWTIFEGHSGIELSEYPREIIMATCIGVIAWLSSLAASALLLRATRSDERFQRYPLAIASACGVPALVTLGLFAYAIKVIDPGTACKYGWSTKSSIAAWMALLLGLGALHGAVALGVLRGARTEASPGERRRFAPLAALLVLAVVGAAFNYRLVTHVEPLNAALRRLAGAAPRSIR